MRLAHAWNIGGGAARAAGSAMDARRTRPRPAGPDAYIYMYGIGALDANYGRKYQIFKASLQTPQRCFTCTMAEGGRDRPVRHRDAYRKYLRDASLPLPRTTQWRRRKAMDM